MYIDLGASPRGVGMLDSAGKIPRRTFLRGGVAVAAMSTMPLSLARAAFASARPRLVRSTFTPLLGSTFHVSGEGNHFDVVLTEINDLSPSNRTDTENQFSLLFQGRADRSVTQGTLTFSNSRTGKLSLFVVPTGRGVKALTLESIINCK
jgi:hypothetical protein